MHFYLPRMHQSESEDSDDVRRGWVVWVTRSVLGFGSRVIPLNSVYDVCSVLFKLVSTMSVCCIVLYRLDFCQSTEQIGRGLNWKSELLSAPLSTWKTTAINVKIWLLLWKHRKYEHCIRGECGKHTFTVKVRFSHWKRYTMQHSNVVLKDETFVRYF